MQYEVKELPLGKLPPPPLTEAEIKKRLETARLGYYRSREEALAALKSGKAVFVETGVFAAPPIPRAMPRSFGSRISGPPPPPSNEKVDPRTMEKMRQKEKAGRRLYAPGGRKIEPKIGQEIGDATVKKPNETKPTLGGAHKDLDFDHSTQQRHHMPCQAAGNKGGNGGAITMDIADHKKTASWDSVEGAAEYRNKQRELMNSGKFEEAFDMDAADIQKKFPNKYNEEINRLRQWYKDSGKF
jgi:hypothetical protein